MNTIGLIEQVEVVYRPIGRTRREWAMVLWRQWRDDELPSVLTHHQATVLAERYGAPAVPARLLHKGQMPLARLARWIAERPNQ